MKVEFEKIAPDTGSSFRLIQWKSANDKFFWHQHPEHELIYVKRGSGKLHIGNHLGYYEEGEVLFLGANLPHTGLGYGVIGNHEELIVQLKDSFLGQDFMDIPEMQSVKKMFLRSNYGIIFSKSDMKTIGPKIEILINQTGLDRLLNLLEILKELASTPNYKVLNTRDVRFEFKHQDEQRINKIYSYVENNFKNDILLEEIAEISNLTVPSFCRYFKKMTHMTFTDFINDFRVNNACRLLHADMPIADVCFESGFNNLSHFNKTFKTIKGKSPRTYRTEIN